MYSKEIKKLQLKNSINIVKLVSLIGLLIIGFVIHTSIWLHVLIISFAAYYFIYILGNLSDNYRKIRKLQLKEEDEKYKYDNYDSFDFNKILEDLYEQARKQNQQYQYYTSSFQNTNKLANAYTLFKLKSDSSIDDIKAKYRELAFKWHPDKWATDTIDNQNVAKRNFQKMQAAYELIKKDKGIN